VESGGGCKGKRFGCQRLLTAWPATHGSGCHTMGAVRRATHVATCAASTRHRQLLACLCRPARSPMAPSMTSSDSMFMNRSRAAGIGFARRFHRGHLRWLKKGAIQLARRVLCRDCLYYPLRARQPGSDMCVLVASARSSDSRPCWPRAKQSVPVAWWRRFFGRGV